MRICCDGDGLVFACDSCVAGVLLGALVFSGAFEGILLPFGLLVAVLVTVWLYLRCFSQRPLGRRSRVDCRSRRPASYPTARVRGGGRMCNAVAALPRARQHCARGVVSRLASACRMHGIHWAGDAGIIGWSHYCSGLGGSQVLVAFDLVSFDSWNCAHVGGV